MNQILIAFSQFPVLAQETPPVSPPQKSAAASSTQSGKSLLMIDPKARAQDYVQAFDLLRKDKPTQKIMIILFNGMILTSVGEITASVNGTLLLIKYNSTSGNKYQVVPVEEIAEIAYSSS